MTQVRLAEVLATMSFATDAGMGQPDNAAVRCAVLAVGLADVVKASDEERADAYWLSLLRHVGCTAASGVNSVVMEDEVGFHQDLYGLDYGTPSEFLPLLIRRVGRDKPMLLRVLAVIRSLAKLPALFDTTMAVCEVGDRLAERFGLGEGTRKALFQVFERWNGKGIPHGLKGDAIAKAVRIVAVAQEAEIGHRLGGAEGAASLVRRRAGGMLDPGLAALFAANSEALCAPFGEPSIWQTFLAAEPGAARYLDEAALDEALRAMADFTDLQSRWFRGHSRAVADLARTAGDQLGLDREQSQLLERAALVHDVGRVAVSAAVWDAPRPLNDNEWERVKTHTFVTERILSRSAALAPIGELAALAHERLDGKGYHRRLPPVALTESARLLAASDCYQAMIEDRPHRPALAPDQARQQLRDEARSGRLGPEAVEAVLVAAGHKPHARLPRPSGLSDREVAVIRLLARGLTNKEIAVELDISTKTAGNHVQHIFEKVGVTTRAAATLYALQHALL